MACFLTQQVYMKLYNQSMMINKIGKQSSTFLGG